MSIQLQRWIGKNKEQLLALKHWRAISEFIRAGFGEGVTAQEVFDILYPDRIIVCGSANFVGFAVGYRTCKKGCPCYVSRLAAKMKTIKLAYSDVTKAEIQRKRDSTVMDAYGVRNVFELAQVKEAIRSTKTERYSDPTFTNPEKARSTNVEKYGVNNVMQVPDIAAKVNACRDHDEISEKVKATKLARYGDSSYNNLEQTQQTNLQTYGVANVAQAPAIQKKISDSLKEKFVPQHAKKYNITPDFTPMHYVPGSTNKWICNTCNTTTDGLVLNGKFTRCKVCHPHGSIPENEVKDFIRSLGYTVVENSRTLIPPKELDIYIPEKKVAIEYCGTYWHTEKYGKTKMVHQDKLNRCRELGIKLITLFSTHWVECPDLVKSRLRHSLGGQARTIYARQCSIAEVSVSESRDFLNQNHIQGYCNAKFRYGLYNSGTLVAVMTFSKSRFEEGKEELIRFAVTQDTSVVGGASKLLSHHLKNTAATEIVTYSDNSWGFSSFYETLGFTKVSDGLPGFYYINMKKDSGRLLNRMQYQKHKLLSKGLKFDPMLTEYQNMVANGFDRIWDCGHSKYTLAVLK